MPDHIFISYARKDGSNTAQKLYKKLSDDNLNPWLDTENGIEPGDNWDDTIEEAIEQCKALVFLMTPGSIASEVCALEWGMAWELKKPLFTVMLEEVKVPFRLRKRHYIDMRDSGFESKYPELHEVILKLDTTESKEAEVTLREEEETLVSSSGASGKLIIRQNQIPELAEKYIGRKPIQAEIHTLLNDCQRVLLHGQGGQGKTSLVAQIANTWIEQKKGDVLWLRAGKADADALFEAFADAVNMIEEFNKADPDDKSDIIAKMIEIYEIKLIVIDDVWNGVALQRLLKVMPRNLPMLITSRQRHPATNIIDLPKLDEQDARELIQYHAGDYADDNSRVDEICKMLGYLAFAIEIAGKVMQVNMWNTNALIQQIKDAPHSLALPEEFQTDDKGTIASLIEASLEVLPDTTREVFRAFGAFPQPTLTVEMAEIFLNRQGVQKDLTNLVRNGLATRISETDESIFYYRTHDLAHSYAHSLFDKDFDVNQVIQAGIKYVENHKQRSIDNFNALEAELDNFTGIIELAVAENQAQGAIQIAEGLYIDGSILQARGYYIKALRNFQIIRTGGNLTNNINANLLRRIGACYRQLGLYQKTIHHLDLAQAVVKNKQLLGAIYFSYAQTYDMQGSYELTEKYGRKALKSARKSRNQQLESQIYDILGSIYRGQGKYKSAIDYYKKASITAKKSGDKYILFSITNGLGLVYQKMGDYKKAISFYKKDLINKELIGNKVGQAISHANLAVTYKELGDMEQSKHHYKQAFDLFKSMNLRHDIKELNELMTDVDLPK